VVSEKGQALAHRWLRVLSHASELESAKAFLNAMDGIKLNGPEKESLLLPSGDADSSLPWGRQVSEYRNPRSRISGAHKSPE
jgi:hypothetical protein